MGAAPTIDLDVLLAPIEGSAPAGCDLRQDASPNSLYYRLKDARSSARSAERLAEVEGGTEVPGEWRTVAGLAQEALARHTKDLEAAAWLTEALLRLNGFAGLRDGFMLIHGLVERYWDAVYPLPDEDGVETRLAPLAGLNDAPGAVVQPIRKVPITAGEDPGPFAAWQYEAAGDIDRIVDEDKRAERLAAGAASLAQVMASARVTPAVFFHTLLDDLTACNDAFAALERGLADRCGGDAPAGGAIRDALATVSGLVRHLAGDKLTGDAAVGATPAEDDTATLPASVSAPPPPAAAGPLRSREDALAALAAVAAYFRQAEPQSLVPAMLDNVIRRGRMSLADLLAELLPDGSVRNDLYTRAGIRPPEDG